MAHKYLSEKIWAPLQSFLLSQALHIRHKPLEPNKPMMYCYRDSCGSGAHRRETRFCGAEIWKTGSEARDRTCSTRYDTQNWQHFRAWSLGEDRWVFPLWQRTHRSGMSERGTNNSLQLIWHTLSCLAHQLWERSVMTWDLQERNSCLEQQQAARRCNLTTWNGTWHLHAGVQIFFSVFGFFGVFFPTTSVLSP